jgi:hypothetical protein
VHRDAAADRQRGLELLMQVRGMWLREGSLLYGIPHLDICVARECARSGDRDGAISVMRKAVDDLHQAGRLGFGVWGAGVLVETLLDRGTEGDVAEPGPRSTAWRTCRQTKVWQCVTSGCCACARC